MHVADAQKFRAFACRGRSEKGWLVSWSVVGAGRDAGRNENPYFWYAGSPRGHQRLTQGTRVFVEDIWRRSGTPSHVVPRGSECPLAGHFVVRKNVWTRKDTRGRSRCWGVLLLLVQLQVHDILHEGAVFALDKCLQCFDACLQKLVFVMERLLVFLHRLDVGGCRGEDDGFAGFRRGGKVFDVCAVTATLVLLERGYNAPE